ncbi:hypothetical protein BZA77DRAFT_293370 [Pyronema omphalodes]|nr:hypothetical protein BZA77DRAFT_293370 [Pyronema omphalodes]
MHSLLPTSLFFLTYTQTQQTPLGAADLGIVFDVIKSLELQALVLEVSRNKCNCPAFESLLSKPYAEYQIVFRRFDAQGNGIVDLVDLVAVKNSNKSDASLPFNWDSAWVTLYAVSQMLRAIQGEKVHQTVDPKATGFIEVADFERNVKDTAGHKLSDPVLDNLNTFIGVGAATKIPHANVCAFHNVMREVDTVDPVVRNSIVLFRLSLPTRYSPLEIVKIRLQVQGELTKNVVDTPRRSAL